MKRNNLLDCDGSRFRAKIKGTLVEGVISVCRRVGGSSYTNQVFLCQDKKEGTRAVDMKGFRYSWIAGEGTEADFRRDTVKVTDFEILDEPKPVPIPTFTIQELFWKYNKRKFVDESGVVGRVVGYNERNGGELILGIAKGVTYPRHTKHQVKSCGGKLTGLVTGLEYTYYTYMPAYCLPI